MNELKLFKNPEFGQIRVIELNGKPWFVGKDIAAALGFKNPRQAISSNVDDEDKGVHEMDTPSGVQEMTIINESGLYSLIFNSRIEGAKKFKHWVTSEVLPSIRETGSYSMMPKDYASALRALADEVEKNEKLMIENEIQRQTIEDYQPKVTYYDTILQSKEAITVSQIAADYGISAKALNKILYEEGIQHRVGGQWILYRKHMGKGYTKSITHRFEHYDGTPGSKILTKWTQKGRVEIHRILENRGIKAIMDLEDE